MSNKYAVITFVIVFVVIAIAMCCMKTKVEENIELRYIKECIESRICQEVNGEYFIGNNLKELENGYYDIKIINTQKGVNLAFNKLWYKQFNLNLYEQDYVNIIVRYISNMILKKTFVKLSEEELNVIYNDILDGYIKVKKGNIYNAEYVIKGIMFKFYSKDYELNLELEVI